MKLTKVLFIIFILTIAQIIFDSCVSSGISTEFVVNKFSLVNLDNSGGTPQEINDNEAVTKNAYGIRINLNTSYITQNNSFNFQFINYTYAISSQQDYQLYNKIQSIKIVTLNNFDAFHQAGDDITEYFNGLSNEYGPYIPINNKIEELNSSLNSIPQYFDVFLMKPPTEGEVFRFRVYIKFNNMYEDEITTDYVTLF